MRILYGVQGTGNGHITRARIMAEAFEAHQIEVDYFFSGRSQSQYFDMQAFGDFQVREGLSFSTEQGKVNLSNTLKQNSLNKFFKDVRALNVAHYDLVFNDFEPISAWAAKLAHVPVVAMSHQAAFLAPSSRNFATHFWHKSLIKLFAPADVYLGVHWHPFSKNIVPPFIPYKRPSQCGGAVANKVLVYLPFEQLKSIVDLLQDFPDREFYCYHPDAHDHSLANVHLRAPSRPQFLYDLANTSGVIANAGFELSSEALKFGKKLLLKPLTGQFEQESNAQVLQTLGLASVMHYLSSDALEEWLKKSGNVSINFPDDPTPMVDWLLQRQWFDTKELHRTLWQSVFHKSRLAA